jgi:hypothetical protein
MSTTYSAVAVLGISVPYERLFVERLVPAFPHDLEYNPDFLFDPRTGRKLWEVRREPIYDEVRNELEGFKIYRGRESWAVIAYHTLGKVNMYTDSPLSMPIDDLRYLAPPKEFVTAMQEHGLDTGDYRFFLAMQVS